MRTAENPVNAQPIIMTSSAEIAELYECHYIAVYRAALRVTGNPADAEDVLQTVFLRILNQGGRPEHAQMPEAYFRRAAVNAAVDLLRRRIARTEIQLSDTTPSPAKENTTLLKEQLRRAIAKLEQNDAIMFLLRYVEGLTNGELAEVFGQEKNSIAVRLHRIRQALQIEMER
jgi:RNA polymerase sigma-70 factor, ECF subfamily